MKVKKLPIFLEITRKSFFVIVLILVIYAITQLIIFGTFTNDYERDLLTNTYQSLSNLSENVNNDISQKRFYEYLEELTADDSDEYIRIYSNDEIYFETKSDVWQYIKPNYKYDQNKVESKFIEFEPYMIMTGKIQIDNSEYLIQIIRENDLFDDFIEGYLPTLGLTLILGLILSAIGAMYVSKNFINRLRKFITTMNEIKEKGFNARAEVSGFNDEIDKMKIVFNSMMDDLEDAFEDQSRFVSDASHELKTPLTALQGHLNLIKRWGKNDKERLEKSIDICLNEVERLKKIVNDMLLLSKTEKEEVDLSKIDEINPKIIVEEVIEHYNILNPNVKYITSIEDNIKMKIDPNDLKQLLIIFIDNSIKYNNKENIEIEIKLIRLDDKTKLEVKDNGMGIPKDELNNVMKRFYKVDKSRVKNNSFGIGLSIASRIVNNYNGKISIDSELDKYTTISIYI